MKNINLEVVYKYLESPSSFSDDDVNEIQNYLVKIKEKLHKVNLQYNVDCELSEYVNSILEKVQAGV